MNDLSLEETRELIRRMRAREQTEVYEHGDLKRKWVKTEPIERESVEQEPVAQEPVEQQPR